MFDANRRYDPSIRGSAKCLLLAKDVDGPGADAGCACLTRCGPVGIPAAIDRAGRGHAALIHAERWCPMRYLEPPSRPLGARI